MPPIRPASVPKMPINEPCTMNTCITPPGVRPRVRRMAMSACLSVTSITCEDTRLKAPWR